MESEESHSGATLCIWEKGAGTKACLGAGDQRGGKEGLGPESEAWSAALRPLQESCH